MNFLGDFELLGILKILRILVVHHRNVIAQTAWKLPREHPAVRILVYCADLYGPQQRPLNGAERRSMLCVTRLLCVERPLTYCKRGKLDLRRL